MLRAAQAGWRLPRGKQISARWGASCLGTLPTPNITGQIKTTRMQRGARTSGCYCLTCCLWAPGKLLGCTARLFLTPQRVKEPALLSCSSNSQRQALQQTASSARENISKSWCGKNKPTPFVALWQGGSESLGSRVRWQQEEEEAARAKERRCPNCLPSKNQRARGKKTTRGQSFKIHLGKLTFHFHLTQRYGRAVGHSGEQ